MTIKMRDKIRVRRMISKETQNFHIMIKHGITWVQLRNGSRNSINLQILQFRYGMPTATRVQFSTWILQMQTPSGSSRHVEVKITSMQGMLIFRRDRMTQLIKCTPWSMRLHPHPTIVKKMKTFLEVENKMGPIIPAPVNQFRPPLPETNPRCQEK